LYNAVAVLLEETVGQYVSVRSLRSKLLDAVKMEGLRVLVVSHGGVGTRAFSDYLSSLGLIAASSNNLLRFGLVHMSKPLVLADQPGGLLRAVVYIFGDPVLSTCSARKQGNSAVLLRRLGQGTDLWTWIYSDLRLIEAMYLQYKAWTAANAVTTGYPIISLSEFDAFDPICHNAICNQLGVCHLTGKRKRPAQQPFVRQTTAESPCVKRVERSLSKRHKVMVEEMRSAAYDTFCARLRAIGLGGGV